MLGIGGLAVALMAAFLVVEARIANPIVPLHVLRLRGLINASVVGGFLVTRMCSTFFLGTLFLERVGRLGRRSRPAPRFLHGPSQFAVLSQGITTRLVAGFGSLAIPHDGMASAGGGEHMSATVGPHAASTRSVSMALFTIGLGIGMASSCRC